MLPKTKIKESNVLIALLLCFFTVGLYYPFWQYKQMKVTNKLLGSDEHSYVSWLFFSIITLGLYHLYHEYRSSQTISELSAKYMLGQKDENYPIFCLGISLIGGFLISDMIHQDDLNKIVRKYNQAILEL